jgi:nucleotide-binding universal stress UspA family protein
MSAGRVVVGVDGSAGGEAALIAALEEARQLGATLEIVYVWPLPIGKILVDGGYRLAEEQAEDRLVEFLSVLPEESGVEMVTSCIDGWFPSTVLVEAAHGAALLVIGRSRHGKFSELIGSTARACIEQSPCPVLVVPAPQHAVTSDGDRLHSGAVR